MTYIVGRIIRYFLWFCLILLLILFLFGLVKFKGNFIDYIKYLNTIDIIEVVSQNNIGELYKAPQTDKETKPSDTTISDVFSGYEDELSGMAEDGYFLPEASSGNDIVEYGFSGNLNNESNNQNLDNTTPASKDDLVNLIKSREK